MKISPAIKNLKDKMKPFKDVAWSDMINRGGIAGHPVIYYREINSTNDVARKSSLEGVEKGTLFIAERQHKGRGRLGRSWLSPPGSGLYFSLVLAPDLPVSDLPKITMAAGVALCRSVKTYIKNPMLKWPNDLLLDGKKVAGILSETIPRKASSPLVILGIGINVNQPEQGFPPDLKDRVSTIEAAYGRPLFRGELLIKILNNIDELLLRAERQGFADILEEWRSHDACRGRYLSWLTTEGRVVRGLSEGIDNDGLLRIRDGQGKMHEVISGDIRLDKTG